MRWRPPRDGLGRSVRGSPAPAWDCLNTHKPATVSTRLLRGPGKQAWPEPAWHPTHPPVACLMLLPALLGGKPSQGELLLRPTVSPTIPLQPLCLSSVCRVTTFPTLGIALEKHGHHRRHWRNEMCTIPERQRPRALDGCKFTAGHNPSRPSAQGPHFNTMAGETNHFVKEGCA